jgi:hypothetical protein
MLSGPSWRRSTTANRHHSRLQAPQKSPSGLAQRPLRAAGAADANGIDKSRLTHPEPRRFRDKEHVKFVAKQACLICGRRPADAHHPRFAQHRALGRKVSDEFTVPLCRGHHREAHRCGDEAASTIADALGRLAPDVIVNPAAYRPSTAPRTSRISHSG